MQMIGDGRRSIAADHFNVYLRSIRVPLKTLSTAMHNVAQGDGGFNPASARTGPR